MPLFTGHKFVTSALVDTSVWIDHFRVHTPASESAQTGSVNDASDGAWRARAALTDSACTPFKLDRACETQQAKVRKVLALIEQERLFGLRCGLVDLALLVSTLMTPGAELWTLDRRFADLAERFGVRYHSAIHWPVRRSLPCLRAQQTADKRTTLRWPADRAAAPARSSAPGYGRGHDLRRPCAEGHQGRLDRACQRASQGRAVRDHRHSTDS